MVVASSSRPSSKSKGIQRPLPAQQTSSSHAKLRSKRRSSVSSSEEEEADPDHDGSDDEGAEGVGEKDGSEDEYRASGSESEDNQEDDDDEEDGGYRERKRRRTSGSGGRGKGKSKLTGSEAKVRFLLSPPQLASSLVLDELESERADEIRSLYPFLMDGVPSGSQAGRGTQAGLQGVGPRSDALGSTVPGVRV